MSTYSEIKDLKITTNSPIKLQGFIQTIRSTKKVTFLILRQSIFTIQCVGKNINLPVESFIEIIGNVVPAKIESCYIKDLEIHITDYKVISQSNRLPIVIRTNSDINISTCLDNRSLHLRSEHMFSIMKILNEILFYFRDFLRRRDFLEIVTPKLIESASEGGANVFEVQFFKRKAYLAQSPQLYKQMAVLGGLRRVFEIGHVYRAEESKINRYLSEFTGLDLEMEIKETYSEVYELVYNLLIHIFDKIKEENQQELEIIRSFQDFKDLKYKKNPLILKYSECLNLLREKNIKINDFDDFSRENEKILGEIVLEKYDTDLFIITEYPHEIRAFYTKKIEDSPYSYSFDFILRGEEILSGAMREDTYEKLINVLKERNIDENKLKGYLDAFKYGVPKHGGVGIGLERLMKAYFGFNDIRYFNMFPRDPTRLYP